MADLQHRTSRKMANGNGFSSKNIYDDVFGGPPKFTAPSFDIEIDDYGEVFGFFSSFGSNGCSSVPVLDFPVDDGWGEDGEVSGGSLSSTFAYSDIFGGLDWGDFAVSYEDLFGSKKQGGSASILSKNTWTPAEAKSWQQSPAVVSSVCMEEPEGDLIARLVRAPFLSHVVSDPLYAGLDQTNMSFQNPNKKTKEDASNGTRHTGQLARAISEFTCGVDVLSVSQKCEIYPTVPQTIDDTPNVSSNGEILEEKTISKSTPPNPVDNDFLKTSPGCKITVLEEVPSNACDQRHSHDSDNDLRYGGEVFITVSEVNLRTEPSRVPPPARPPPQLVTKGGVSERLMTGKVKVYADKEDFHNQFGGSFKTPVVEEVASQSSPPFFDVEVDASSAAAAASAAAMKEAMERAEARLKSAKYSMEKKRDIKGRENGATKGREIMGHAIEHENLINKEEAAREVCKEEDRGTQDNLRVERQRNAKTVPDFEDRERQLQFAQESREREFGKNLGDTQEAHERGKKSGEWKAGKNFYEWEDHEKKFKAARDVFEQGKKEKKLSSAKEDCKHDKNEKKLKEHKEAHDREEIEKKLKAAKETYNREENEKKLKAAQAALVREENEKKQKVAQEAHEREENERKLKLAQEQGENERKLKLVREAHEWEENERKLKLAQEVQERKENERTLKLAQKARQREENERKLKLVQEAHEREENERKLKLAQEAREQEENEKKLKLTQEARMREENERKLKLAQEVREREEDERKLKVTQEARKQEETEKKLKSSQEAREREENERKLKLAQEAREWEENERRLKLAQEAREMEENERKLKLSQVALEHEENTWKLKLAEEACKQEENQRELKLAQETCEPKDNESKLKSFEEVREREANGRKLKMSHQDCSWKENEKELIADQHVNVRDGKKTILNKFEESHEIEETESKMRNIEIEDNKRELTETVRVQREREQEKERLRKIEEEKEREHEREKDRIAVERATREARERAFEEVRERASAEARGKAERASMEARLKTERAAVERATAEARERAIERALAEKASQEARERVERSVAEKFAATCRQRKDNDPEEFIRAGAKADDGMKRSPTYTEFEYDLQFQSTVSSSGTFHRYSDASDYGDTSNYGFHSVEKFQEAEGESAKRCKAKLERQQRIDERVAKALAEKKLRDILALREQAERNRLAETLDADIRRWSMGKEGNLRALLSTLQYILWPESGWQSIPLTEVITAAAVKKAYRKATLCVHPDKVQQRGASIQQKYISEKVFDLLKEAWNRFNSEER